MFVRFLVSALAALALVSGASGQTCSSSQVQETCTSTQMSSTGPLPTDGTATLNLGFTYCAPLVGYGVGTILALQSGTLSINGGSGGTINSYRVTGLTGGITTGQPGSVTIPAANTQTTLGAGQAPILQFSGNGVVASITANGETVSITSNAPSVILGGVQVPFSPATLPANLNNFNSVSQDSCTAIRGDPLFSGFMGQQFYVGGEDGQVFNMLATHNMQLNGRFVNLEEGAAMMPVEQEKLRLQSLIAHQSAPSVAAFPRTEPWSHPGNYFGEIGVALMDDNRIHAKAGAYATGFAKVTLNGRPIPVADEFIVLGQGVNTTFVQRVSAHELMVRTVNVEFTLTNSDNFLNVENIHLEKGAQKQKKFGGMLGHSVSSQWSWAKKDEEAAVVKSNNLFELTTISA